MNTALMSGRWVCVGNRPITTNDVSTLSASSSGTASSVHVFHEKYHRNHMCDSDRLFGRARDILLLRQAFARVSGKTFGRRRRRQDNRRVQQQQQPPQQQTPPSYTEETGELVVVHGAAGTGKTKLVEASLRRQVADMNGFYVCGKFDQRQMTGESFSALIAALSDLCDLIVSSCSQNRIEQLSEQLLQELEEGQARDLTKLIPNLSFLLPAVKPILGHDNNNSSNDPSLLGGNAEHELVRLCRLCRSFLRVVATEETPVVVFLDDLQWADNSSMQIIRGLASCTDDSMRHVLLVVAFRDSDPESDQSNAIQLRQFLRFLRRSKDITSSNNNNNNNNAGRANLAHTTVLPVGNLDTGSINQLVSMATKMNPRRTSELSTVVTQKTQGNVFFALQFLDHLQREGLLVRPEESKKEAEEGLWNWDIHQIRGQTNVSDNVVSIITKKLQNLPEPVLHNLQLASFLGHRFSVDLLRMVLNAQPNSVVHGEDSLADLLDVAVSEGVLEQVYSNRNDEFKFSHDRVQSCLYAMRSDSKSLHLRIGRILAKQLSSPSPSLGHDQTTTTTTNESKEEEKDDDEEEEDFAQDVMVLQAADHMNLGSSLITDSEEKLLLVRINLRAGSMTLSKCAYAVAVVYFRRALSSLNDDQDCAGGPANKWKNQYGLTLQVVTGLAKLEYCTGNGHACEEYCQEVIREAKDLVPDKLEAYTVRILSLGSQNQRLHDAVVVGVGVLRELGQALPARARMRHMVQELTRVKLTVQRRSDEDLLSLPPMHDAHKLAAMKIMSTMVYAVFSDKESKELFGVVGLRMLYLTVRYGYSDWAPFAFALFGGFEAVLGHFKESKRFMRIANILIDRTPSKEAQTRGLFIVHALISQWSESVAVAVEGFQRTYTIGMQCSDVDFALYAGNQYLSAIFQSSKTLSEAEADARVFCTQMREFQSETTLRITVPLWQLTLNLMGCAEDHSTLTGEAMNEKDHSIKLETTSDLLASHVLLFKRLQLAVFFENWTLAEKLLPHFSQQRDEVLRGHFTLMFGVFFEGLAEYVLYHRNKHWKHRKKALSCTKRLEGWSHVGVVNCRPLALLLRTERYVLSHPAEKDRFHAIQMYDHAIASAESMEILQWQALFAQRAFTVLSGIYCDMENSIPYLYSAIGMYTKWEAFGVVHSLSERFGHLLVPIKDSSKQTDMVVVQ